MMTILRVIVLLLSLIGSWEMLRRKTSIHIYFLPSLTIAIQTSILFVAGLLNILLEMAILLFLFGLAGLIVCIVHDRGVGFFKHYCRIGFLFLAVAFIVLFIAVQGRIFTHYDNFSHWALVVRQMLFTNRFPNFSDAVIEFQQYPLGSAVYIYFFSRIAGEAESVQMFAQGFMMISCMVPLFLFCRKHKWASFFCVLMAADFILVYNIAITDLLVDTLLPVTAMCGFLYVQQYGRTVRDRSSFYLAAAYLLWIVQIKNAGLFFAAFLMLWILLGIRKNRHIADRVAVVLIPLLSVYLWYRHCSYAFPNALATKHAMAPGYYASVFAEKSSEEIREIISGVLGFSFSWPEVWLVFGFVLLVGILVFLFARSVRGEYLRIAIFSVVFYILFQLGLIWMYLFSMPSQEASYLAEIQRYTRSALTAVVYLIVLAVIRMLSDEKVRPGTAAALALLIIAAFCGILFVSAGKIRSVFDHTDDPTERNRIEEAAEEYHVPLGASYCILTDYEDGGYYYYLGKYIFRTTMMHEAYVTDPSDLQDIPSQYVFIVDQDNEIIREWVRKNYPEQEGNAVIIREEIVY